MYFFRRLHLIKQSVLAHSRYYSMPRSISLGRHTAEVAQYCTTSYAPEAGDKQNWQGCQNSIQDFRTMLSLAFSPHVWILFVCGGGSSPAAPPACVLLHMHHLLPREMVRLFLLFVTTSRKSNIRREKNQSARVTGK